MHISLVRCVLGVFDRGKPLPVGGTLEQADGTSWMAFYCVTMLNMALELARTDSSYEDIASKFFEHFVQIADTMNGKSERGGHGIVPSQSLVFLFQLKFTVAN